MACVSGILLPCWTFYHETVSIRADNLEGSRIKSCAEFISLVLLDKDFITYFDTGMTGTALCVCIIFGFGFLFSIAMMYFLVINMLDP